MFKILDRYIVREILLPFLIWLVILTFMLLMPPILDQGEKLIEKGFEWSIVVRVLSLLVPQALSVTIPMALLLAILIGLGRLSADREFVALQACGVSVFRVLRSIALLALVSCALTAYVIIAAVPNANQAFRELAFSVLASHAESDVKPRVFFEGFPNRVLYVRDLLPGGGWRDVFLADGMHADQITVYLARQGRLLLNRDQRTAELLLDQGTRHTTFLNRPDDYEGSAFDHLVLSVDANSVFPEAKSILKGDNEKTIAELRATIAENEKFGRPTSRQFFTIQQKFAIPGACLVLALIGVALGVSNSKDGKLAGFVLGIAVIIGYYLLLWMSQALAVGDRINPSVAPWMANLVLGIAGLALLRWRSRAADRPITLSVPGVFARKSPAPTLAGTSSPRPESGSRRGVVLVIKVPHFNLPHPRLLDIYISKQYLRIFLVGVFGLLGLFYISTFIDLADKLFRGSATTGMLLRYFYFATPQYFYYIIPMAALVATLVVLGLLTKNSELIVMRACGVSIYRSSVPLLVFAVLSSVVLFELQEHVLAESNRRAEALRHVMRGFPAQTFGVLDRRWMIGTGGEIYHYEYFDPRGNRFSRLSIFRVDPSAWRLTSLTYAKDVSLGPQKTPGEAATIPWQARDGWTRQFSTLVRKRVSREAVGYAPFGETPLPLESPGYFKSDEPEADRMTYGELKRFIEQLQASGFHVVPYMVQLQRKVAFPFVTVIMTLLAVPFAVTTGRRGALYGIGLGIVLSIGYWTMLSVFGAIGAGGLISPMLAAWAPNILFGSAAAYMVLTIRT
jgi:LPS export ABC transporter permease LptG/LPS export ABC transporter permease LptF